MRKILIEAKRLYDRHSAHEYLNELFRFPDYYGRNLDALADSLSEVEEDTELIFTPEAVGDICDHEYAFRILMVLGRAADENPHLRISFQPRENVIGRMYL